MIVATADDSFGESIEQANDQARFSRPRPSHGRPGGGRGDSNAQSGSQAKQGVSMYPDEDDDDDDDENVSIEYYIWIEYLTQLQYLQREWEERISVQY